MNSTKITLFRIAIALLVSTMLVSGCSSSSDSQSSAPTDGDSTDGNNVTTGNGATDVGTESDAGLADGTINETPSGATAGSGTVPADPTPNSTRVTFDITVPVFVSNALQVRLVWGDINTTAMWLSDESWQVIEDLPTNTVNPLVVTFSDDNGSITLASFETNFRTGPNATEIFQINADQFDSDRWDSDNDGVSNLSESLAGSNPLGNDALEPVQASLELVPDKTFRISWQPSANAQYYRILENPDGLSGYTQIGEDLDPSTNTFDHRVALYNRVSARYIVQTCGGVCVDSDELAISGTLEQAIGYLKPSTSFAFHNFGAEVSLSANGKTLAVSRRGIGVNVFERINEIWIEVYTGPGDQAKLSADGNTMALVVAHQVVGVYTRSDTINGASGIWQEQARLEASNGESVDGFGHDISLSGDGNTLVVGAVRESSDATGINGDQSNNSADSSGAVYVFKNTNGIWQQQAYVKASNTDRSDRFGASVSISKDGNTLAVGASGEGSSATGINGNQADNSTSVAGAVYLFSRENDDWQQRSYIKQGSFVAGSGGSQFGYRVRLSADGNNLAVSSFDSTSATGINGNRNQVSDEARNSGAVYFFVQANGSWQQQAFIKASNRDADDYFGGALSMSGDGKTLVVGAAGESSSARGINGNQQENSDYLVNAPGATYVFVRNDENWFQKAYLKASNTGPANEVCEISVSTSEGFFLADESGDAFGSSVSISEDGETLVVGAPLECSAAVGFNGDQTDNSASHSGAVYIY